MVKPLVTHTLPNGLLVVVEERRTVPVVAVNIWYNVGSRHEQPGQKGLAHLFEHLMFQGSRNVASGELSAILEGLGADFNATTSMDRTNYFATVPARALEMTLWLEADRMATLRDALTQQEFEAQRAVVKNERLQTMVNPPYGEAFAHAIELLFPDGHPYSVGPIGEMAHLDAATLEDLRAFFDLYYAPNNAVLSIVGDVDTDEALAAAERYFGGISRGADVAPKVTPTLAPLDASPTRVVVSDVPQPAVYRAWVAPPLGSTELDAMRVAAGILGGGRDTRFGRRLIRETGLAVSAHLSLLDLVGGNSLMLGQFILSGDGDVAEVNRIIDEEIADLASNGPTAVEFETEVAQLELATLESAATVAGRADQLSRHATFFADPRQADDAVARLHAVTPEAVAAVTRAWLDGVGSAQVEYRPSDIEPARELIAVGEETR